MFPSHDQGGDKNALGSTIRDLTLLSTFVQALPGFYEGTEYLGSGNATRISHTGKDDFLFRGHVGERVVPSDENRLIGNMSNPELAKVANLYQKGMLQPIQELQYGVSTSADLSTLESKLDQVTEAIKSIPQPVTDWDSILQGVREVTKQGNNRTIRKYRA